MDTALVSIQAALETTPLRIGAMSLYGPAASRINEVWGLFLSGDPEIREIISQARAPDARRRRLSGNTVILPLHDSLTRFSFDEL